MGPKPIARRTLLRGAAVLGGGLLSAPFVRGAHAAGPLTVAFWDHWVPGANDALHQMVEDWAVENRIDVRIDFVTSVGAKNVLTARAEARARVGHDLMVHPSWQVSVHQRQLESLDDLAAEIERAHGKFDETASFLARLDGNWKGLPAPSGSHGFPMVSRLDLMKELAGVDLRQVFPADRSKRKPDSVDSWTWEVFLAHAEKLHRAGRPFAGATGAGSDAQNWLAPLFLSFGSVLVNARGEITVDSDQTRNALEYVIRLAGYMPDGIHQWDEQSNNDWLVSGQGTSVVNPPSAWAVASRDKPDVAQQLWHHDMPRGPNGRFRAVLPHFFGVWDFARNKPAAKALIRHLSDRETSRRLVAASRGYDLPLVPSFLDFDTWSEVGPPKGTIYNYPTRGDETTMVAGYPAPPRVAALICNQGMVGALAERVTRGGESVEKAIAWATRELDGYLRA